MAIFKQIQTKFWQNDYVLELTPEERYFYMYLITNTMTNICGIYRFNLKLAELETGLRADAIKKHLDTFERSRKIIISKRTKEIMIVNWMKHNFKMNKKTVSSLNTELKEVKDKELLKKFYEICQLRQYPVDEIFKGIIMLLEAKEEAGDSGQAIQQGPGENIAKAALQDPVQNIAKTAPQDSGQSSMKAVLPATESVLLAPGLLQPPADQNEVQAIPKPNGQSGVPAMQPVSEQVRSVIGKEPSVTGRKEIPAGETLQPSIAEVKKTKDSSEVLLFKGLKTAPSGRRRRKEKRNEEIEVEIPIEEEPEQEDTLIPIVTWNFNDSGGAACSSV